MLIAFPLGLLGTSVVWDICALATAKPLWGTVAYWTITAGIISGLVAAIPGFIDWLYIPKRTRARAVGVYHMLLNVTVLVLFAISLVLRHGASGGYAQAGFVHMVPGWIGVVLAVVSAWFGGELVETLGIAVHDGANPNAPSSLRSRHTSRVAPGSAAPPP